MVIFQIEFRAFGYINIVQYANKRIRLVRSKMKIMLSVVYAVIFLLLVSTGVLRTQASEAVVDAPYSGVPETTVMPESDSLGFSANNLN